ncbi:MAG TPA: hypothetical protein VKG82_05325 [Solirubrobacteraceae bacterium]|nr:hypothetical protein [Solirubrobacteraceae bacterium]
MARERSRYGLFAAALGAALLAVSVFLPWYGVSLTAQGVSLAQSVSNQIAEQFGNATLRADLIPFHASLGALVGQQVGTVSAHQAFKYMSIVLIVLAALALLDSLSALARASALDDGAGASLVLLGAIASLCVLYHIVYPPSSFGGVVSLSLRAGAWLSLLGALLILGGGLWGRVRAAMPAPESRVEDALAGLSGWTPQN